MKNKRRSNLKRILMVLGSLLLAFSMTACTVPYTYISIAGNYIGQHKESFPGLIEDIEEGVQSALETLSDDPESIEYFRDLLRLGQAGSSAAAEQNSQPEESRPGNRSSEDSSPKNSQPEESRPENSSPKDSPPEENKPEDNPSEDPSVTAQPEAKNPDADDALGAEDAAEEGKDQEGSEAVPSILKSPYIPEYVHFEKDDFVKLCDSFKKAGRENDTENVQKYYGQLVEMLKQIATMDSVAFINFSVNVNEKYYDEEYSYNEKLITDCEDLFYIACREVLESDGAGALTDCADPSVIEDAKDYEALSDHAKDLLEQESRLENKYSTELDGINSITYELNGKTYKFEELYEDSSALSMLSLFNYNDFITVYKGLLQKANDILGPIYLDLLAIRVELAKEFDYDNYSDYCYEEVFGRGYTTKDAQKYCDVIKKEVGPKYYQNAYYSLYNSSYFETEFTLEEIYEIMDDFTRRYDRLINDSLKELKEKELYDIGSGEGRYKGSYTTDIYSERVPFIFINSENTLSELSTLEHEFGHFTNALYEESKDPNYFFVEGNYDVFEIHSNALQLLCSNHYGEIVPETEAREAKQYELSVQLSSIIDGCIYDEFQRKVYETPDITLDGLNDLYAQICAEYGAVELPGNEYMWMLINHNFESPLYYISYSVSALSALEIWTISQNSEKTAVNVWMSVMKEADDEDYETVMKHAGLTPFTDSRGVVSICNKVLNEF